MQYQKCPGRRRRELRHDAAPSDARAAGNFFRRPPPPSGRNGAPGRKKVRTLHARLVFCARSHPPPPTILYRERGERANICRERIVPFALINCWPPTNNKLCCTAVAAAAVVSLKVEGASERVPVFNKSPRKLGASGAPNMQKIGPGGPCARETSKLHFPACLLRERSLP